MGRWQPNARGRLEQAAMELFDERGFEPTTVAEIAERAGLTERTFFRHFQDKREVLFAGGETVQGLLADAVAAAPASATPLEAVRAGLVVLAEVLERERGRELARRRQRIVAANDELRERELIKLAAWATAVKAALRGRGVDEPTANLSGEIGIAVFRTAFAEWVAGDGAGRFPELVDRALDDLRALSALSATGR